MDEKVIDKILIPDEKASDSKGAKVQPNIWRTIVNSKVSKLATAAAVILIASVGIILLEKSATPLSAAEQQIQEIVMANEKYKGWVHVAHELFEANKPMTRPLVKAAFHINTVDGTTIYVGFENEDQQRIRYESPRNGVYAEYNSMANEIYFSDLPKIKTGHFIEMREVMQSQLSIGSALWNLKKRTGRDPYEIKTTKDGTFDRFDIVFLKNGQEQENIPASGSPITCSPAQGCPSPTSATLWVDPNTNLIHKVRSAIQSKTRVSIITYGEPAISDIHDLGVPRTAKVIDSRSTVDTKDVLDRLDNRIEAFGDYLAILTETPLKDDGTRDLDYCALNVLAQHGQMCLFNRYLVGADTNARHRPRQSVMGTPESWPMVDVNSVLTQLKDKFPCEFFIYDGNDLWSEFPLVPPTATKSSIRRFVDSSEARRGAPAKIWFGRLRYNSGPRTKMELLKKENGSNQIGLHIEYSQPPEWQQRLEQIYWLDPTRDDMPTSRIERDYTRDGKTVETEFESCYLDYSRLPDGRWYSTRWQMITTYNFGGKSRKLQREYNLYIYPHKKLDSDWFTNPFDRREE
jgi:hypothetical protein